MNIQRLLLRMSRWSRNPPSAARIKMILVIIAIGLAIYWAERLGWWPDWATARRMRPWP